MEMIQQLIHGSKQSYTLPSYDRGVVRPILSSFAASVLFPSGMIQYALNM